MFILKNYLLLIAFYLVSAGTVDHPEPPGPLQSAEISDASAHWVLNDKLIWNPGTEAARFELRYSRTADIEVSAEGVSGGVSIQLIPGSTLSDELADRYRHIADRPVFDLETTREQVAEAIQGQVVAIAYNVNGEPVSAARVQHPGVIDQYFFYDGVLGPDYSHNQISLHLWAPTAQSVSLNIYDNEKKLIQTVEPKDNLPQDGVWRFTGDKEWDKMYYRFNVTVYHPENNRINEFVVTDPYSVSLTTDSRYSQFADLENDDTLKPAGWDEIRKIQPERSDITLYEVHLRDFSIDDETVSKTDRGSYQAFTYNGENEKGLSNGMNHLIKLHEAGLTHLHLLPLNDIASIIEEKENRVDWDDPYSRLCEFTPEGLLAEDCARYGDTPIQDVFETLATDNPVTKEIQKTLYVNGGGLGPHDGFNWGYDPYHFNTPEGSYSTNPEGVTRIIELRNMVKALYQAGLKIVVDVVYNHTHASGLSEKSVLDKVVPGYYHRLDPTTGEVERSTCCENTAAEHAMMEKLMIDSILLWAKEYKIDSFRFDLMGHHPKRVMENIQQALAQLTIEKDGVDGSNIYIYGEGWDFGEVAGNRIFEQATQFNTGGTGIGNFNDRIRDAIRGGNFEGQGRRQGFANGQYLFPNNEYDRSEESLATLLDFSDRIRVGMAGNLSTYEYENRFGEKVRGENEGIGYTLIPFESVNYIDKHDNETLWDNTQTKNPAEMKMADRIRIHMLSNAFINFGQGIPFYQAGTDLLRSKSLDRNSYDSGDWYNAIDFSMQTNTWAKGLPNASENRGNWDQHREFLTNPNIEISQKDMELTHQIFLEQLMIRYSSPLFRLQTAEQVNNRVAFHNTGPDQVPGIIAMTISDGVCTETDLDDSLDGVLVLFNADTTAKTITLNLEGMRIHAVLAAGKDPLQKESVISNGSFTIPGLTATVFEKPQQDGRGEFPCNEWKGEVKDPGSKVYFEKPENWSDDIYLYIPDPEYFGQPPGSQMTKIDENWYTLQLPDGVNRAEIIFRDSAGNKIESVRAVGSGCLDTATGNWKDLNECDLPVMEVAFKKPGNWSDTVHVYTFSPEKNGSWPGEPMINLGNNWYYYQFEKGVNSTNIIFNDSSGNQTNDLYREGSGCYINDKWLDTCQPIASQS